MPNPDSPVHFLRKKDYLFVKVLGQGACGQTVLLRDEVIGSDFVCKKYVPFSESHRQELFRGFLREIKLLHEVFHPNVVRVFNYYVYPENFTGYILMEYIDGNCIDDYVREKPETVNDLFIQAIEGFAYLESASILHRDIRPQNVMVHEDGTLKIIDLGFGKRAESSADYDKSISLNWWCEPPQDFDSGTYSHSTEVYFVGKLFQALVLELQLEHFQHAPLLSRMCERNPSQRIDSFAEVRTAIQLKRSSDIDFSWEEKRPLVVSCGAQQTEWPVVVEPGGHVGRLPLRLSTCPPGGSQEYRFERWRGGAVHRRIGSASTMGGAGGSA